MLDISKALGGEHYLIDVIANGYAVTERANGDAGFEKGFDVFTDDAAYRITSAGGCKKLQPTGEFNPINSHKRTASRPQNAYDKAVELIYSARRHDNNITQEKARMLKNALRACSKVGKGVSKEAKTLLTIMEGNPGRTKSTDSDTLYTGPKINHD